MKNIKFIEEKEIAIEKIVVTQFNFRGEKETKEDFITSLDEHGIKDPLWVWHREDEYELIDGHRRYAAAKECNHDPERRTINRVPVIVVEGKDKVLREFTMARNTSQKPFRGTALLDLVDDLRQERKQSEIAPLLGVGEGYVSELVGVLALGEPILKKIHNKDNPLTIGHAKQLRGLGKGTINDLVAEVEAKGTKPDEKVTVEDFKIIVKRRKKRAKRITLEDFWQENELEEAIEPRPKGVFIPSGESFSDFYNRVQVFSQAIQEAWKESYKITFREDKSREDSNAQKPTHNREEDQQMRAIKEEQPLPFKGGK